MQEPRKNAEAPKKWRSPEKMKEARQMCVPFHGIPDEFGHWPLYPWCLLGHAGIMLSPMNPGIYHSAPDETRDQTPKTKNQKTKSKTKAKAQHQKQNPKTKNENQRQKTKNPNQKPKPKTKTNAKNQPWGEGTPKHNLFDCF